MKKRSVKPFRPVYPSPAGLIPPVDDQGRANIITLGEVFNLSISKPVIVGIAIAKPRYSHELISATREYVVNLPTQDIAEQVWYCGSVSGRNVDKFAGSGLTRLPASHVKPPLIAECPVNLECKVSATQVVGDHDLFLGEVVAQHVDEDILSDDGKVEVSRLNAFAFVLGEFWTLGVRMGR